MNKIIKISAVLEISDHCGYCSSEDCEYESSKVIAYCDMIPKYEHTTTNEHINPENHYWEQYFPEPELNTSGSYYYGACSECDDLDNHSYRYTITHVEIIENANNVLSKTLIDDSYVQKLPIFDINDDIDVVEMLDQKIVKQIKKYKKMHKILITQQQFFESAKQNETIVAYKKYYDFRTQKIINNVKYNDLGYQQYLIENDIDINNRDYDEKVWKLIHWY
jgi:hypothetical protein